MLIQCDTDTELLLIRMAQPLIYNRNFERISLCQDLDVQSNNIIFEQWTFWFSSYCSSFFSSLLSILLFFFLSSFLVALNPIWWIFKRFIWLALISSFFQEKESQDGKKRQMAKKVNEYD